MALRKAMVAFARLSQSTCPCSKPSLPRKCLWYRNSGTSSHVSPASSVEQACSTSASSTEMKQTASSTLEDWGQSSLAANEWTFDSSLLKGEMEHMSKLAGDDWPLRNADEDLPIHIQERLANMHLLASVPAYFEMQEMESRMEDLYRTTTSAAEKAVMEEPTRALMREKFDPLTLERFAMKLVECGVLRAMSTLYLLRRGMFGRATRELVDLLYSIGFVAKGQEHRSLGESREIEGTSLRYYPKSMLERAVAAIPAKTWIGLPRRLDRLEGDYFQVPPEGHIVINSHTLELKHGAFVSMEEWVGNPTRRLQVFKGLEEGVVHLYEQRRLNPFAWRHRASFILPHLWPIPPNPPD